MCMCIHRENELCRVYTSQQTYNLLSCWYPPSYGLTKAYMTVNSVWSISSEWMFNFIACYTSSAVTAYNIIIKQFNQCRNTAASCWQEVHLFIKYLVTVFSYAWYGQNFPVMPSPHWLLSRCDWMGGADRSAVLVCLWSHPTWKWHRKHVSTTSTGKWAELTYSCPVSWLHY